MVSPPHLGKILVVDDSDLVLDCVRDILSEEGYEVVVRSSPMGTSSAVLRERPDLVLLDLMMPSLNGDQIVPLLRRLPEMDDVRIVLHSDRPEEERERVCARCGADGHIGKTADAEELVASVRACMARPRRGTFE